MHCSLKHVSVDLPINYRIIRSNVGGHSISLGANLQLLLQNVHQGLTSFGKHNRSLCCTTVISSDIRYSIDLLPDADNDLLQFVVDDDARVVDETVSGKHTCRTVADEL